ncbi:MAG TPA: tRNA uridine-5-carboxymethylaminomethyl(34) synthesis GTPase MnmE, partial [Saprospiraceae bacterium]|nr:tRNA uridine-5-carboxymethylaminomethyl(34) synthesis GTPase MnmE [Saprospiraceae bacterium]
GMQNNRDTIAAVATPPGVGAIGVVRVSGPDSIPLVNRFFDGADLESEPGYRLHFGRIHRPDGTLLDEVLLSLFRAPRSYTGEDSVEISCHGSPYILQEVLNLLLHAGARSAQPGEFTQRAFLNGRLDLSQAEAVADLIASETQASHTLAMSQLKGGIKEEIGRLRASLLDFISLIELELDFAEEDVEFANRNQLKELLQRLQLEIRRLQDSFVLGNAVRHGIQTVIAGKPNAGKSTLLNALLNEERALVSEIAGTTRDTIEEKLNINGIGFQFIDTAGLRETGDVVEEMGVKRTMEKLRSARIAIYVFDVNETPPAALQEELKALMEGEQEWLAVANKMDLNPYVDYHTYVSEQLPADRIIPCSAKNKMNIDYLKERLYQLALGDRKMQADTVAVNARHLDALNRASDSIHDALSGIESKIQTDLLAQSIRRAIYELSEISGEITSDEVLGNIFGKFCIGK